MCVRLYLKHCIFENMGRVNCDDIFIFFSHAVFHSVLYTSVINSTYPWLVKLFRPTDERLLRYHIIASLIK